jgi:NADPH-dependent curcumin reductase CurA
VIGATFGFNEAPEAYACLKSGTCLGKVLISFAG